MQGALTKNGDHSNHKLTREHHYRQLRKQHVCGATPIVCAYEQLLGRQKLLPEATLLPRINLILKNYYYNVIFLYFKIKVSSTSH